jgi:putative flippase GtrA
VRFAAVSGVATVVDAAVYMGLLWATRGLASPWLWLGVAVCAGYLLGTWVHFVIARRLVFHPASHRSWVEAALVYLVAIVGLGISVVVVEALVHWPLHLHPLLGKALSLIPSFLWNYGGRRWLVYRKPGVPSSSAAGIPARSAEQ